MKASLPPASVVKVIESVPCVVCGVVCVVLGLWDLCCALTQWYRTTLCTIDLHCAPLTCIVHHDAQTEAMFVNISLWDLYCAQLQRYRAMLCTTDLRFQKWYPLWQKDFQAKGLVITGCRRCPNPWTFSFLQYFYHSSPLLVQFFSRGWTVIYYVLGM